MIHSPTLDDSTVVYLSVFHDSNPGQLGDKLLGSVNMTVGALLEHQCGQEESGR